MDKMAAAKRKPPEWEQQTKEMEWQQLVSFNDVAVYFTIEEWSCLNLAQKRLYKEVMIENYANMSFLNAWYGNESKHEEHHSKRYRTGAEHSDSPGLTIVENLPLCQTQAESTGKLPHLPLKGATGPENREFMSWGQRVDGFSKNTTQQGNLKQEDHKLSGARTEIEKNKGSASGSQISSKEDRQAIPASHPQEAPRTQNSVEALQQISFCKLPLQDQLRIKRMGPDTPPLTLMQILAEKGQLSICNLTKGWYDGKKWLCGSATKNALFCFPCLLFGGEETWTSTGVRDLQRLAEHIKSHEVSEKHIGNHVRLSLLGKPNITPQQDKNHLALVRRHNEDVSKNRYILSRIINCVLFCGAFELPLDGHDEGGKPESPAMLRGLIDLISSTDVALKLHLQSSTVFKDLSKNIHKELLDCTLVVARSHIKEQLKRASFAAVEVDHVGNISSCKQGALILRYIDKQGVLVERFYGFIQLGDSSAGTVASALLKQLEEIFPKDADKLKLIAQSYDGAVARCGEHKEIQKRIQASFPNAHYVHSYAHRMNMVMQQAASHVEGVRTFFVNLSGLVAFFAQDPQRSQVLKTVAGVCFPASPQNLCSFQTLSKVFKKRQKLIKCFEQIKLWRHDDAAASAAWGFKLKLEKDGEFLYLLSLFHRLRPCMAAFCFQLRKAAADPAMVRASTTDFVKGIIEVRESIGTLFAELPPESRLETGKSKETLELMASEVCHNLIKHGKEPFAFTSHSSGERLLTGTLFSTYNRDFPQQAFSEALEAYPMLEQERLKMELTILYKREEFYICKDASMLLRMLLESKLEWALEQTVTFLRILVTSPLAAAEPKETSVQSRIKTFLQSSASKPHHSALAMLSIEKQMVKEIRDFNHRTIEVFSVQAQHQANFLFKR